MTIIKLKSALFKKKKSIRILVNRVGLRLDPFGPDIWQTTNVEQLIEFLEDHITVTRR